MMSQRMFIVGSSVNRSRTAVDGVGHQDHVRLVDPLPTGDRRAVEHLAVLEDAASTTCDGTVTCCSLPRVSVNRRSTNLTPFSFDELENVGWRHGSSVGLSVVVVAAGARLFWMHGSRPSLRAGGVHSLCHAQDAGNVLFYTGVCATKGANSAPRRCSASHRCIYLGASEMPTEPDRPRSSAAWPPRPFPIARAESRRYTGALFS